MGSNLTCFLNPMSFRKKKIFFKGKKKTFQGNYIIFWKGVFLGKIPWVLENHYHEDKSHGFFGKPIQEWKSHGFYNNKKIPFLGWKFLDFGNSIDCGSLIMENFMNFKKIIIFNENNGFIGYSLFECTFGKTSFEDIVYCESLF